MNSSAFLGHSCPQQVLRLVEYVSEALKPNVAPVFFDVAKAFDRQTDISHLGMSALTRQDVLSEQEFLKAPPSLLCCTPRTQTMYRDRRRLASNSRYSRTIPRSFTEIGIGAPDSPSSPQRAIDELGQWFRKWRIEVNPTNQQPYNSKYGHRPKLPYSTRPPLPPPAGQEGRNRPMTVSCDTMPRRLPPGVVHSACHAPSALACAVRPHSVKLSKSSDLSSDSSRPTK
ncbi:hypothetical protein EVAR_34172_1 [Eumeta japonica]|uniref:Uncharacterized protein n=1 Tax=Eumeta variegata TaxID=151549 RepID=A0A4C1WKM1_EUMVA|nr:hypothetical protein EVAR_34172_1 [Eumeta japonica]